MKTEINVNIKQYWGHLTVEKWSQQSFEFHSGRNEIRKAMCVNLLLSIYFTYEINWRILEYFR